MTNKHTISRDNIILMEGDDTIVDNKEVCEIFNDYFANIASSIGFEDAIVSVYDALHKHSSHPSVIKIKESLTGPNNFTFQAVSPDKSNQKLMAIDIKKATGCDHIPGKIVWPTMS